VRAALLNFSIPTSSPRGLKKSVDSPPRCGGGKEKGEKDELCFRFPQLKRWSEKTAGGKKRRKEGG